MNSEVPRYLGAAAVLAAPSRTTRRWAEQVGMSAIQALACRVPVVLTPSGSTAEFIDDGVTGWLVPEGDPAALAAVLSRVLINGGLRREFIRARAARYTWKRCAELTVDVYREAAAPAAKR